MVLSCLVEPLVTPLIGRGTGGRGRRSAIPRSRLAASALAMSALLAVATNAHASDLVEDEAPKAEVIRNAHAKPAPIPQRILLAELGAREEQFMLAAPGAAPDFEWDSVLAHRLEHSRDQARDSGPGLGLGRRIDRLRRGGPEPFWLFASGLHQSGAPNPVHS